jgi:hypothetical protein
MKRCLGAALLVHLALAHAADWSNYGGDPQRSGWQRHEKKLSVESVKGLKLLWKRQLDNQSKDLNSLTAPTMLGPIITHRGIKELVFIAGSSDNLYAVDADLGKVFWRRHFDTPGPSDPNPRWPCGGGLTATPAIAPDPDSHDDEDEDDFTSLLPIYVLSSDGNLHTVRPSDGVETAPPLKFIPANANASSLNLADNSIYTTTSDGCGGASTGVWAIAVNRPDAKARFVPSATRKFANFTPVPFRWKGRGVLAAAGGDGRVLLLAGGRTLVSNRAGPASESAQSIATWEDAAGTRWIYAAGQRGVAAFKLSGDAAQPKLALVWRSRDLGPVLQPAVANGVLFALASSAKSHAILYALDAATGKELNSSGDTVTSYVHSSGLAVANGHVCFGTWDNTLYCFGLPLEI